MHACRSTLEDPTAVSVIFLFNLVAVLVFPGLGHLMGLSDAAFGLWAGSAVNDTSAAVAAGYAYSPAAGDQATIVKLTRTTLIVPLVLLFALWTGLSERRAGGAAEGLTVRAIARGLPLFLVLFLAGALLNSAGLFGDAEPVLRQAGRLLLLVALAAVGLQARLATAVRMGTRPILLGLGTWGVVALAGLAVQAATGRL